MYTDMLSTVAIKDADTMYLIDPIAEPVESVKIARMVIAMPGKRISDIVYASEL